MKKSIFIQTQGLDSPGISKAKPVGFVSLNFDNLKIVVDAYNGNPCYGEPRTDSLIKIIDDKEIREMTAETLLTAIRFFERYNEMGTDVVRFKNLFHIVIPDEFKNAQKR